MEGVGRGGRAVAVSVRADPAPCNGTGIFHYLQINMTIKVCSRAISGLHLGELKAQGGRTGPVSEPVFAATFVKCPISHRGVCVAPQV